MTASVMADSSSANQPLQDYNAGEAGSGWLGAFCSAVYLFQFHGAGISVSKYGGAGSIMQITSLSVPVFNSSGFEENLCG